MSFSVDFSALADQQRADIIYQFTPDAVWQTQTGSQILDRWRSVGLGIRTQTFFGLRAQKLSEIGFEAQIADVNPDQVVPAAYQTRPVGFQQATQRQYRFRAVVSDPDLGEQFELFFALNTDDNLTIEQALEQMGSRLLDRPDLYEFNIDALDLVRVYRGDRLNF